MDPIYVDHNLVIGHTKEEDKTIAQLQKEGLVLKVEENLHDYLSCDICFSQDKKQAWLGQPHLISNLDKKFGLKLKVSRNS